MNRKIFGIGLPKTGTKSLTMAMALLGFKSSHYPRTYSQIKTLDFCCDTPVLIWLEQIRKDYPDSIFINHTRPYSAWIDSMKKQFDLLIPNASDPVSILKRHNRIQMFGTSKPGENHFNALWDKNKASISQMREQGYNVNDFHLGQGWQTLCLLVNRHIPPYPYPHIKGSQPLDWQPPRIQLQQSQALLPQSQGLLHQVQERR